MRKNRTNPTANGLRLVTSEYHPPSEYRCLACNGTGDERFLVCPGCGAAETCVPIDEERGPEPSEPTRQRAINARFIAARKLVFLPTGRPAWDKVLGGGVVRAASFLVAGRGGVGKSTSALSVAMHVGAELGGAVLYASSERPADWVKQLALRIGCSSRELDRLFVTDTRDLADVVEDIDRLSPVVIVWDSIQRFRVDGRLGDRELVETVATALERGAAHEAVTLLLSQVTKEGTPAGPNGIDHDADAVLFLRRTRGGRVAVECPEKNRFAATPARALEGAPKKRRRRRTSGPSKGALAPTCASVPPSSSQA
jgi:DNA repair protein RadA/Sms